MLRNGTAPPFRRRRVPPYRTHRFIRGVSIKYPGSPAGLTRGAKTAVMPFRRTQSTHNPDGTTHGRSLQVRKTERRGLTGGAKTTEMPFRRRRVPPYRTHRFIRGVSIKYPGSPAGLTRGAKTAVMPFRRTQSTHNPDGTTHGRSLQVRKTERRGLTGGAKTTSPFRFISSKIISFA